MHVYVSGCACVSVCVSLALLSPWVVCAANVYDLNQANSTGLFRRIGNDLQDAATEPKTREGNRWKSQGSAWSHSLTRPLHLSPSGFVPSSVSASLPVCVSLVCPPVVAQTEVFIWQISRALMISVHLDYILSFLFFISPQKKQENPHKLYLFSVSCSWCAKASSHVVDSSLQIQEKWNNKSTFFMSVSCKISPTRGC